MARVSCIEHPPRDPFFVVRKCYLSLFDDFCTASVLAVFEFWSNGELARMDREEIPAADPWIATTIPEIKLEMLGMYSERSINDALKRLVDTGLLLKGSAGRGSRSLYLLNVSAVNDAIRNPAWNRENCKIAVPDENCKIAEDYCKKNCKIAVVSSAYKEEEVKEVKKEDTPLIPQEPTAEPSGPEQDNPELTLDTFSDWLHTEFAQMSPGRKTTPLRGKLVPGLFARYQDLGEVRFAGKLQEFADTGGRSLDEFARVGGTGNLGGGGRLSPAARTTPGRSNGFSGGYRSSRTPRAQQSPSVARELTPPDEAAEWNTRCPAHAWRVWDSELDAVWHEAIAAMNGRYEAWLAECEKLSPHAVEHELAGTFSLKSALKNWAKVLNGGYSYLLPAKRSKNSTRANQSTIAANSLMEKLQAQIKAEKGTA